MTPSEVARLFAYCTLFDGRLQPDEGKILAWSKSLARNLPMEVALQAVSSHYGVTNGVITPADINHFWYAQHRNEVEQQKNEHMSQEAMEARAKASKNVIAHAAKIRRILRGVDG